MLRPKPEDEINWAKACTSKNIMNYVPVGLWVMWLLCIFTYIRRKTRAFLHAFPCAYNVITHLIKKDKQ